MSFQLVSKSVTLNDIERRNGRYFAFFSEIGGFRGVCLSSVTLVLPTQAVVIFHNISTALGTMAIRRHPLKILRRSSQGNPSAAGVKHNRGSKI